MPVGDFVIVVVPDQVAALDLVLAVVADSVVLCCKESTHELVSVCTRGIVHA